MNFYLTDDEYTPGMLKSPLFNGPYKNPYSSSEINTGTYPASEKVVIVILLARISVVPISVTCFSSAICTSHAWKHP